MTGTLWIWIPLGVLLLLAAAYSLARFAIGDRPHHRRRCPKCWYDLDGIPDACPECGRKIRSQRELSRTRRHKRWAALGVALALLGAGSLATRQAIAHGAVSLVPDWVLIAGMQRWPEGELNKELQRRHWEGELSEHEQRRLIRRSLRLLQESDDPTALARAGHRIQIAEFLGRDEAERHTKPWGLWMRATEVADADRLVLALIPLLSHPDTNVSSRADSALSTLEPEAVLAFPAVFTLAHQDPANRATEAEAAMTMLDRTLRPYMKVREIVGWRSGATEVSEDVVQLMASLSDVNHDRAAMRELLRNGLEHGSEQVRLMTMWIIRSVFWPDDELRRLALADYDPESKLTGPAIVDFAVAGPLDAPAAEVIRRALQARDYEHWAWAVERLGEHGREAAHLAPDILAALGTHKALMSAIPYAQITADRETPARRLVALAREYEAFGGFSTLRKLGRMGWVDEDVVAMWRAGLASEDANTRMVAAAALLRNGPPDGFDRAELTRIAAESCIAQYGGLNGKEFGDNIQYGEADIPTVLAILDEHPDLDRSLTVWLLGMAGTTAEAALPWLERALIDPDADVASNAALSIRRIEWCLKHGDPPPEPRDKY